MTHWSNKYLGMKWREDFHCGHFAKLILEAELGVDLTVAFESISNPLCVTQAGCLISRSLKLWSPVDAPKELDLCVMGKDDVAHHLGVFVDKHHIIHLSRNSPACCAKVFSDLGNKYKLIKSYRYAKDHTS